MNEGVVDGVGLDDSVLNADKVTSGACVIEKKGETVAYELTEWKGEVEYSVLDVGDSVASVLDDDMGETVAYTLAADIGETVEYTLADDMGDGVLSEERERAGPLAT